jgi:hypothetical protein
VVHIDAHHHGPLERNLPKKLKNQTIRIIIIYKFN